MIVVVKTTVVKIKYRLFNKFWPYKVHTTDSVVMEVTLDKNLYKLAEYIQWALPKKNCLFETREIAKSIITQYEQSFKFIGQFENEERCTEIKTGPVILKLKQAKYD